LLNSLLDKIISIAEKMSLGKLTVHTACQYIDRMLYLNHKEHQGAATSTMDLGSTAAAVPQEYQSSSKHSVITPDRGSCCNPIRRRVVVGKIPPETRSCKVSHLGLTGRHSQLLRNLS
jgi:hypothetical protein